MLTIRFSKSADKAMQKLPRGVAVRIFAEYGPLPPIHRRIVVTGNLLRVQPINGGYGWADGGRFANGETPNCYCWWLR